MKSLLLSLLLILSSFTLHSSAQELTAEQIFDKYSDAVVVITTYDLDGKKNAQGSGIILQSKGIIVTNFHLYAGSDKIEIKHKDSIIVHSGILGANVEKDILILKAENISSPDIPLFEGENLKVGQKVYAIGSPLGFENTMSDGIISGLRTIGKKIKKEYIQITASISPGSSGGAVFNSKGELIGMSSMTADEGQNINFAVPITDILKVVSGSYMDKTSMDAMKDFYKGYNEFENGKYKEAIEDYTKYIQVFPLDAKAYNHRGMAYYELKKYKQAIADYDKSVKLDTSYIPAYENRGETYYKMEEYANAIKDFIHIIKVEPDNMNAYYSRGLVYLEDEQYEKAIKDFTRVIDLDSHYAYGYINRGFAYYWCEDYEYAMLDWERAIKIDNSFEKGLRPYINRADLLDRLKGY